MGCDIHCYIDYDDFQDSNNKWWVTCWAQDINIGRNYTLFTLMAGVRFDERVDKGYKPLFAPKGIPDRLSHITRHAYAANESWEEEIIPNLDWHTASWLSASELRKVQDAYENILFPERSWYQHRPPEEQEIPENAIAIEIKQRFREDKEWYIEAGEKKLSRAPEELRAIITAMMVLNNGDDSRSRLVFWFDN